MQPSREASGGGGLMFKKRWEQKTSRSGVERKEKLLKAVQLGEREKKTAGNLRERKIGLGDMFKRVRGRWIRGGVE